MRTTTGTEDTRLSAPTYQVNYRVKVANGSGTMKDWTSWVETIDTDENVDQPVEQLDIEFRRDFGSTLSLSPFRTDSTLNVLDDNVTFSPAIDVGRLITVEFATTPIGTAPVSGDWKQTFHGTIDDLDFDSSPMKAVCRDDGGDIVDAWVETEVPYAAIGSLEGGIQRLLDARFGAGVIPLYTPTSPGYALNAYKQQVQSLAAGVEALEQLIGWDVRYLWDNGTGAYRYTLWDVNRAKVTPDYTFGPSRYLSVKKLGLQKRSVRNVIIISYKDAATGTRATVTVSDGTSIARYKRQVLLITEADDSPINSNTTATTMANAALADMKDPKAEFEIDMFLWWPAMLNDLYRFSANNRHFNSNQDWAVVGIKHHLSIGQHRTTLTVRGKPTGGYDSWVNRGDPHGDPAIPNTTLLASITQGSTFTDTQESVVFSAAGGDAPLTWRWRTIDSRTGAGAWSAFLANTGINTLPVEKTITRGARWNKIIEFQYQDGAARFSNIPSYVVDGIFDSLDTSTGRVKRSVPADDGNYHVASTSNDGLTAHGSVKESGTKPINKLYAKPLSGSPDHADSINTGTLQRVIPFSVLRQSDDQLLSGVDKTASVAGISAHSVARQIGRYFNETFEELPSNWTINVAPASLTLVFGVASVGLNVLQSATGEDWRTFPQRLPFNPTKLYRIRSRFRATVDVSSGGNNTYIGVGCYDSSSVWLGNIYVGAFGVATTVAGGWIEMTGWYKGLVTSGHYSSDPTAPKGLFGGTTQISPLYIFRDSAGVGGTNQLDYIQIDELDEDLGQRAYSTLTTGGGVIRSKPYDDGGYGVRATNNTGLALHASCAESGTKLINKLFAKSLSGTPDDLSGVPDDALAVYRKTRNVDSSGKVTQSSIAAASVGVSESISRSRAKAYSSASTKAIPNGTIGVSWTIIDVWNSTSYNVDGVWAGGSPSRLTVPSGGNVGLWRVEGLVSFSSNATGSRGVGIFKNGTLVEERIVQSSGSAINTMIPISYTDDAPSVGDYYEIACSQNSGISLNGIVAGGSIDSYFQTFHSY